MKGEVVLKEIPGRRPPRWSQGVPPASGVHRERPPGRCCDGRKIATEDRCCWESIDAPDSLPALPDSTGAEDTQTGEDTWPLSLARAIPTSSEDTPPVSGSDQ